MQQQGLNLGQVRSMHHGNACVHVPGGGVVVHAWPGVGQDVPLLPETCAIPKYLLSTDITAFLQMSKHFTIKNPFSCRKKCGILLV